MTKNNKAQCMNRLHFKEKDNNKGGELSIPNEVKIKACEFMLKTFPFFFIIPSCFDCLAQEWSKAK